MGLSPFSVVLVILIYFSTGNSQDCPCMKPPVCNCPPVPKDRCKREVSDRFYYPYPGTLYKDTKSGKYYFQLGKTVYVERTDGYYMKWVTCGDKDHWALNDNNAWQWDNNGRWHTLEKKPERPFTCPKIDIPIKCVGKECPDQIRFPSDGKWYIANGKMLFEDETRGEKYEPQSNGLYHRFKGSIQICPDFWAWNTTTGFWYGMEGEGYSSCQPSEGLVESRIITGPTGVREGDLIPPRSVFGY